MLPALLLAVVTLNASVLDGFPVDWEGRHTTAIEKLGVAQNDRERFYVLPIAAKAAFELGEVEEARAFAKELLALAPRFVDDWNYGNAIHDGHIVLGRVALTFGDIQAARKELDLAGHTPGSPQLNTFGPNMSLARELLLHEQPDAVLRYFELCAKFWELDRGNLARWREAAQKGAVPDFGANLLF